MRDGWNGVRACQERMSGLGYTEFEVLVIHPGGGYDGQLDVRLSVGWRFTPGHHSCGARGES